MGWFTNQLFGQRQRIDPSLLNSYQEPYLKMVNEQEDIARQQMDPNSLLNQTMQNNLQQQQGDVLAQQNLNTQSTAAMQGVSPGQMAQMTQNQSTAARGQFGNQMQGLLQSQFSQGMGGLQNVMGARQGEAERLSNMHIQQVNAANARRQANMNLGMDMAKMAMGVPPSPNQTDPSAGAAASTSPTNMWGGSWTPYQTEGSTLGQWGQTMQGWFN